MNTVSENLPVDLPVEDMESAFEVDSFSTSLAPVNRTERFLFGLKDRVCCISLMATFVALMRLLLSK